jgi:hypothetical protein
VGHGETALAHDAADWNATMIVPHYINEHQSDIRGIKPGWYATDLDGDLSFGPFSNREKGQNSPTANISRMSDCRHVGQPTILGVF